MKSKKRGLFSWFSSKGRTEMTDQGIKLGTYEIDMLCLEDIPFLKTRSIQTITFDISVTQLRFPADEVDAVDDNGRPCKVPTPELFFNLKKIGTETRISLEEACLPNYNILVSKCVPLPHECRKERNEDLGQEISTRLVYDAYVFSEDMLKSLTITITNYENRISEIMLSHKKDLDNLGASYDERLQNSLKPYKDTERVQNDTIKSLKVQVQNSINEDAAQEMLTLKNVVRSVNRSQKKVFRQE